MIYNISADRLRPILAELVERLDPEARWAGDSLALPGLGVQLYVDNFAALRSMSLVSAGGNQSHQGWRRLEAALSDALGREEGGRNPSRPEPFRRGAADRRGDRRGHRARTRRPWPNPCRISPRPC